MLILTCDFHRMVLFFRFFFNVLSRGCTKNCYLFWLLTVLSNLRMFCEKSIILELLRNLFILCHLFFQFPEIEMSEKSIQKSDPKNNQLPNRSTTYIVSRTKIDMFRTFKTTTWVFFNTFKISRLCHLDVFTVQDVRIKFTSNFLLIFWSFFNLTIQRIISYT